MYFSTKAFAIAVAASVSILNVSASPLLERRADTTSSSSSSTSTGAKTALLAGDSTTQTIVASATPTGDSAASTAANNATSTTTTAAASTSTLEPSHDIPDCTDPQYGPFCYPKNNSAVAIGESYYVTWDPSQFATNATVTIIMNWANDSDKQAYSSDPLNKNLGFTTILMENEWLQGYTKYNLTIYAQEYDPSSDSVAPVYKGPTVELGPRPVSHYSPPDPTPPPDELGLKIGLPVSLGFVLLVVVGLFFGMRHKRHIGIGNIMGSKNGYGSGKSRRQRLGLGKKNGPIRLQETEVPPPQGGYVQGYRDDEVSDSERLRREGNTFRDEIRRQQTGR